MLAVEKLSIIYIKLLHQLLHNENHNYKVIVLYYAHNKHSKRSSLHYCCKEVEETENAIFSAERSMID